MKPIYALICEIYCSNHRRILEYAEKLSDAQLSWQAVPGSLSIAFYLWHMGRWADYLQAAIPGMTPALAQLPPGKQVWEQDDCAREWGFNAAATGYAETGMEMDETVAARLVFPPRKVLFDYVRRAFAAAEKAVNFIDDEQFMADEQPQPMTEGIWNAGGSVGEAILVHLSHDYRHLGMIECLVGLQGGTGTATV